jgi:hypothetical protein
MRSRVALVALAAVGAGLACASTGALAPGERLLVAKCGACHVRPTPDRESAAAWPAVLDRHRERVPLTSDERLALEEHLVGASAPAAVPR